MGRQATDDDDLLSVFRDKWTVELLCDHGFIQVRCQDIRLQHIPGQTGPCLFSFAGPALGSGTGKLCDEGDGAALFHDAQEGGGVPAEAQEAGVAAALLLEAFHVPGSDAQQDVEQRPADAGVGHLLCLEKTAELVKGEEVIPAFDDAVCQLPGDVRIPCQAFLCLLQ